MASSSNESDGDENMSDKDDVSDDSDDSIGQTDLDEAARQVFSRSRSINVSSHHNNIAESNNKNRKRAADTILSTKNRLGAPNFGMKARQPVH